MRAYAHDERIEVNKLLPRWIAQLPVLVDSEEFEPVCSLLNDLVLRFVHSFLRLFSRPLSPFLN
jgi:hypothetical protein